MQLYRGLVRRAVAAILLSTNKPRTESGRFVPLRGISCNGFHVIDCRDPLGRRIKMTREQWESHVLVRHPQMAGQESFVQQRLEAPDSIHEDKRLYRRECYYRLGIPGATNRYLKVVVQFDVNDEGTVITAYTTRSTSPGERHRWP